MKRLVLMRHARAAIAGEGHLDHARPLTAEGETDALRVARALREEGLQPQALISSPALRAVATARRLAQVFALSPTTVALREDLYEASPGEVLTILQALDAAWDEVLLVGHNPSISQIARALAPCPFLELPPAGAAWLALDIKAWAEAAPGCGRLLAFHRP